jgi:hypothetical protein
VPGLPGEGRMRSPMRNAGHAGRRHGRFAAQAELFGRPTWLRAARSAHDAVAARHAADDRARPRRADPPRRHFWPCRSGRPRRRRHFRPRQPRRAHDPKRRADARALRLEGADADDPPAIGRRLRRRHRHLDAGRAAALRRLHAGAERPAWSHADRRAAAAGRHRGAAAGHGSRHLLFAEPRRAGAARHRQADVLAGKKLFYETGCAPATRRNSSPAATRPTRRNASS